MKHTNSLEAGTNIVLKPNRTTIRKRSLLSPKEVETLKGVYGKSLSEPEFKVFLMVCERTKLDPFKKQVYAVKRFDSKTQKEVMSIQTGIDGFRALAMRTGRYAGQDDVIFEENGLYPKKATVTVYSIVQGMRVPFTASAYWSEYYPGEKLGFMWRKLPHTMLGKTAEALALRKMAPEDTSGLYLEEEMQQAGPIVDIAPKPVETSESEFIESEMKEMDEHISGIAEEATQTVAESISDIAQLKVQLLGRLIGKGKPFGTKVKDAKIWLQNQVKTDFDNFTKKDCDELEKKISENFKL